MYLVVNKLLEIYGHTTPIHVLVSWEKEKVEAVTGWIEYLRRETGVRGDDWPTYPAYLLLFDDLLCWPLFQGLVACETFAPSLLTQTDRLLSTTRPTTMRRVPKSQIGVPQDRFYGSVVSTLHGYQLT